jgi:hypothetical protein
MAENTALIDAFIRERESLLRAADAVAPDLRTMPFVGHWNLMDVLTHLVGWDYTNVSAIDELLAGKTPAFYGHYDRGWVSYNQQLLDRYGAEDWETLQVAMAHSQAAVVGKLRQLSDEEMTREIAAPARRRPLSIAGILRAALHDEREHLRQLRTFLDSQRMEG